MFIHYSTLINNLKLTMYLVVRRKKRKQHPSNPLSHLHCIYFKAVGTILTKHPVNNNNNNASRHLQS